MLCADALFRNILCNLLMLFFIEFHFSMVQVLVEGADALFRNIPSNFMLMLFLLSLIVPCENPFNLPFCLYIKYFPNII